MQNAIFTRWELLIYKILYCVSFCLWLCLCSRVYWCVRNIDFVKLLSRFQQRKISCGRKIQCITGSFRGEKCNKIFLGDQPRQYELAVQRFRGPFCFHHQGIFLTEVFRGPCRFRDNALNWGSLPVTSFTIHCSLASLAFDAVLSEWLLVNKQQITKTKGKFQYKFTIMIPLKADPMEGFCRNTSWTVYCCIL